MFDSGLYSSFCSLPAALQTFRVACCSLLGAAGGGFLEQWADFQSMFFVLFCFSAIDLPSYVGHARVRQRRASRAQSSHQTRPSYPGSVAVRLYSSLITVLITPLQGFQFAPLRCHFCSPPRKTRALRLSHPSCTLQHISVQSSQQQNDRPLICIVLSSAGGGSAATAAAVMHKTLFYLDGVWYLSDFVKKFKMHPVKMHKY